MESKQTETKNNNITYQPFQPNTQTNYYTPYQDLYTPTSQKNEINSYEPFIKDEETPEFKTTFKDKKPIKNCIGLFFAVYILFFSWPIINILLKESSEINRISTGIDFMAFFVSIFYLAGLTLMIAGVKSLLLKEKKLKECFIFIGIGVGVFLFIMIFDYVFPIYEAIVIDNNKNITFLKNKIFVPLGSKKKLKNEEIKSVNIVTKRNMVKNEKYYGFSVIVTNTNDEKFTGFTSWYEEDNKKNIYAFLKLYLGEKVNSY